MSIRIGGGVGGRYSRPIKGITSYENRILQNNEHKFFWQDSKFCIDNKIFLIVNIDTYLTGGRWLPTNTELRAFAIDTKNKLKAIGANKSNCRFTCDNESNEYCGFDYYANMMRVEHDALNGEFDLGAGNFHTTRIDLYNQLAAVGGFEILDLHFQDGMDDINSITYIASKFPAYKRRAVTEGNDFYNVSTLNGHNLLKCQINVAEQMGCEDFCFPFVNWTTNSEEGHGNLTYCVNEIPISVYWEDMLNVIKLKKPVEDDMTLDKLYKLGSRGIGVRFIQRVLNVDIKPNPLLIVDGIWGLNTANVVKQYQTFYGLKVDGLVGQQTMKSMILEYPEIWNEIEYDYSIGVR